MAALSEFHRLVRIHVPTAAVPTIDEQLRLAMAEFCERTRVWHHRTSIIISAPADQHPIPLPAVAEIVEIEAAWLDNNPLEPASYDSFTPEERERTGGLGSSRFISQVAPGSVSLIPRGTGELALNLFLRVPQGIGAASDLVPDFLLHLYGEAIADGAISRLLAIPSQAWTDYAAATFRGARFESACNRYFAVGAKGQQRTRLRMRSQFF